MNVPSSNITPYCHIFSLISRVFSLMQNTKEVNPHPRVAPCFNMWSVFFFFLCPLVECWCMHMPHRPGRPHGASGPHQRRWEKNEFKFHDVTRFTNSIVSLINVNITKLRNITCIVVATCVILRNLECTLWSVIGEIFGHNQLRS